MAGRSTTAYLHTHPTAATTTLIHPPTLPTQRHSQGAAQLDADLSAISAVFGEYTGHPAAHFRESREACRLLGLPHVQAVALLRALEAQPRAAKALLAPHGVKALNAEQAAVVLLQRLDVLTDRSVPGQPAVGSAATPAAATTPAMTAPIAPTGAPPVVAGGYGAQAPASAGYGGGYQAGYGASGGGIEV